mgnify:CR=1 FL=1
MKKLLIMALLFVGCEDEEDLGNCILERGMSQSIDQQKCYEGLYTYKECLELEVGSFDYEDYIETPCAEYCKQYLEDHNRTYSGTSTICQQL